MGMTYGTVKSGGSPQAGVTVRFRKGGVDMGAAITDANGRYTKYLPGPATYTAEKEAPSPTAPCTPSSFNIPAGTWPQDLEY